MGLMEQLKADLEQITSNVNEFAVTLDFKSPTGEQATITGIYSDHSNAFDADGNAVTGKFTHVTISEKFLTDQDYPTRTPNVAEFLALRKHFVTVHYADGKTRKYIVDDQKPDYTINLHTLILSEYNGTN